MPKNTYRLADNSIVPGCTTICSQLDKPALINWAWKLGQEGKDWRAERDAAGDKGTDVHDMIMAFCKGEEVAVIGDIQKRCFEQYMNWLSAHKVVPVLVETPLVSEKYRFGGQADALLLIDGVLTLQDIKTSKAIYENYWYQFAGYDLLLREHKYRPKQYQILRLGQDGTFEDYTRTELKRERQIFKALLDIYYWRKE